jgi:hypothetical protein
MTSQTTHFQKPRFTNLDWWNNSVSLPFERAIKMETKLQEKQNGFSTAISAVLGASAGVGIGWALWLAIGNIALAIGLAGPSAFLAYNFFRKVIK